MSPEAPEADHLDAPEVEAELPDEREAEGRDRPEEPREPDGGSRDPGFRALLRSDVRAAYRTRGSLRQDLSALYHFYLDSESRQKLEGMGRLRRHVSAVVWLFGSMLRKLSPGRRLAMVAALVIFALAAVKFQIKAVKVDLDMLPIGFLLLLVVLMLELKDKLLAKDEIAIARKVQLALLPDAPPQLAGWSFWMMTRPANDVGGDLVDALEHGGGRLGIALGDVAGKGLGAALLMAKLQATLRALAPDCQDLGVLAGRLNEILERDGLANRFATLFYCEMDADRNEVRFVNAGHNPPYVLADGQMTPLAAGGIPLGVLRTAVYRQERVELAPGQILLVYSDGVTEARNAGGEEFGEARLRAELAECTGLAAQDAGERILAAVGRFTGSNRPHDDLSLVAVARKA